MRTKLAGTHLPLQELINRTLESAQEKLAASKKMDGKVKRLVEYEKKYHGHIPSVKEEEEECEEGEEKGEKGMKGKKKEASASFDLASPEYVDNLAQALEFMSEKIAAYNGGESPQGGMQLETNRMVPGMQPYSRDSSASHNMETGEGAPLVGYEDNPSKSALQTNLQRPAQFGKRYPEKGVLKTGGVAKLEKAALSLWPKKVRDELAANPERAAEIKGRALGRIGGTAAGTAGMYGMLTSPGVKDLMDVSALLYGAPGNSHARHILGTVGGAASTLAIPAGAYLGEAIGARVGKKVDSKRNARKEEALKAMMAQQLAQQSVPSPESQIPAQPVEPIKTSAAAVNFILGKIAGQDGQGGDTGWRASGEGPGAPSDAQGGNDARRYIKDNQGPVSFQKVDGKKPQKRMLSEVLSEEAYSKARDKKVHENWASATEGGVKIASVTKEYLQKIASDPSDPRHARLVEAMKSLNQNAK